MTRGLTRPTFGGLQQVLERGTLAGLSETQLLHRYLAGGDERAFEVLVARHGPMVRGVCRRLLNDPHDVEDAFQATFLILIRKASAIREPGRLSPWLYGVAYRVAARARGRKTKEIGSGDFDPAGPADDTDRAELRAVFDEELSRLPESSRAPIVLCYLEGRTHDEAAAQLGWPVGTVRSRLSRARDRLRDRLVRRGIAPSVAALGPEIKIPWSAVEQSSKQVQELLRVVTRTSLGRVLTPATTSGSVAPLVEGVLHAMWMTKLGISSAVVLAAIVIGTGTNMLARPAPASGPPAVAPGAPVPGVPGSSLRTGGGSAFGEFSDQPRQVATPRELQARLRQAQRKADRYERLRRNGAIPQEVMDEVQDEVDILKAQIADEITTLEDSLELLEAQRTAQAEVVQEHQSRVSYLKKLFDRMKELVKTGAVGSETHYTAENNLATEKSRLMQQSAALKGHRATDQACPASVALGAGESQGVRTGRPTGCSPSTASPE